MELDPNVAAHHVSGGALLSVPYASYALVSYYPEWTRVPALHTSDGRPAGPLIGRGVIVLQPEAAIAAAHRDADLTAIR